LNSYFDIDTNPSKWGFMRAGAAIFREGLVRPLGGYIHHGLAAADDLIGSLAKLHLEYDRNMVRINSEKFKVSRGDMLKCQIFVRLSGLYGSRRIINPSAKLDWSVENGSGLYYVGSGAGVLAGDTSRFERCQIDEPAFAVITATPLDGLSWPQSSKILITACGRCENSGMEFSKDRRTVGRQWGREPVQIETVKGTVEIPRGSWNAQALGPDGLAKADVPIRSEGERNFIEMSPKYKTMWYLLVKN
jgi:hypothetical protein